MTSRFCVLFFFILSSTVAHSQGSEGLNKLALEDGFGYKTANLMLLEEKLSSLRHQNFQYYVPKFFGVSSQAIQKFIEEKLTISLHEDWLEILKESGLGEGAIFDQALDRQIFPDKFLTGATKLETKVREAFKKFANSLEESENFQSLFPDVEEKKLIEALAKENENFMVRSTGREDTDQLANAGGNESIAFVEPKLPSLVKAIGQVVASYFGERSLTQRLLAGDRSLQDSPFTPVLLQRMIRESEKSLPRVGVMFTDEPAAFQAKKLNRGAFSPGTGTPLIQAAYGYNGAVVDSLISVDSYFLKEGRVYSRILPKPFRMVPPREDFMPNTKELITVPALSEEAVKALGSLAVTLEEFYEKSMDVEFAIVDSSIYVLQARPLVANMEAREPSYLNFMNEKVMSAPHAKVVPVGAGGGSLKLIQGKEEVVFASSIKDALKAYQGRSDKRQIEAILIKEMAVATSHEATEFARQLKPVLSLGDQFESVSGWFKEGSQKFIIDVQQGRIVKWQEEGVFTKEALVENLYASLGWIHYPIPQFLSVKQVSSTELPEEEDPSNRYEMLYGDPQSAELSAFWESLTTREERVGVATVRNLLHEVKIKSTEEARLSLSKLWLWSLTTLRQAITEEGYSERAKSLLFEVGEVCLALANALDHRPESVEYLTKRLFYTHLLEVLIFQDHKEKEGLAGDSVLKILKEITREKRGADVIKEGASSLAKLAGMVTPHAFTEETKVKWISFINGLEGFSPALQQNFYKELMFLGDAELLVLWLNFIFPSSTDTDLESLIGDIQKEKLFLESIKNQKNLLNQLQIDNFSDPKTFERTWEFFSENLLSPILKEGENSFLESYKKAHTLGKLAALDYLEEFIATFDVSIKSVTGSPLFEVTQLPPKKSYADVVGDETLRGQQISEKKDKIFTFHLMLRSYSLLLSRLGSSLLRIDTQDREEVLNYLSSQTFDPSQLQVSSDFDVNAIVRGSSVNERRRNMPHSHEEFFTWVHQDLLILLSESMQRLELSFENLPQKVQLFHEKINKIGGFVSGSQGGSSRTTLVGFRFQGQKLSFIYNYPQRNHSARIEYEEDLKTRTSKITLHISGAGLGAGSHSRYEEIETYNLLEGIKNNIATEAFSMGSQGVEIKWQIKEEHLDAVISLLRESCSHAESTEYLDLYFKKLPKNEETFDIYLSFLRQGKVLSFFQAFIHQALEEKGSQTYKRKAFSYLSDLIKHFSHNKSLLDGLVQSRRNDMKYKPDLMEDADFLSYLAQNLPLFFTDVVENYEKFDFTPQQKRELVTYCGIYIHNEKYETQCIKVLLEFQKTFPRYNDEELVFLVLKNFNSYLFQSFPSALFLKALDVMSSQDINIFTSKLYSILASRDVDFFFRSKVDKIFEGLMTHRKMVPFIKANSHFFFDKYRMRSLNDTEENHVHASTLLQHFTTQSSLKELLESAKKHWQEKFTRKEEAQENIKALEGERANFSEEAQDFFENFIFYYKLIIFKDKLDAPELKGFVQKNSEALIENFKLPYIFKVFDVLPIFQVFFQLSDKPSFKGALQEVILDIKENFPDKAESVRLIESLSNEIKAIDGSISEDLEDEEFSLDAESPKKSDKNFKIFKKQFELFEEKFKPN